MSLLFDVTMYGRFNEIRNSEKRQFTMASNNDKKLTSTEIVIQEIAETILSGELKPGDKLLTERELAEKYQVTRSCVREAIRSLSLIGMLVFVPVVVAMLPILKRQFLLIQYCGCTTKIFMNTEIFTPSES